MCRRCPFVAVRSRIVVAICLLGYLGATIGFPLPSAVAHKPGRPFPCQQHACGCASAEQCWKSCCCFTPPEKLAWARANHVEPPAELLAELAIQHSSQHDDHDHCGDRDCGHDAHGDGDSHDTAHPSVCAASNHKPSHPPAAGKCCSQTKPTCGARPVAGKPKNRAERTTIVIGPLWRSCRGLSTEWCASGAVAPSPPVVGWIFQWDVCQRLAPARALSEGGELAPPVPPPPQV